jgi:hypothetical protein
VKRLTLAMIVASCALGFGACGGSEAKPAPGTPTNPLTATRPDPGSTATAPGAAKVPSGEPSSAAAAPNYEALLERQKAKPQERFTPCNLVTRSEAEDIIGKRMQAPFEAQQGPTCIYRPHSGSELVGLTVQQTDFDTIKRQIEDLRRADVSGRKAYCGTYGQPMLYLPLSDGRLLSVNAKCNVARGFATKALRHL